MRIASLPVSELSHVICRVMFPVLSKMKDKPDAMRETFLSIVRYSSLISIPMSIGIATFVPPVIRIVYGDKWVPMIVPLQFLAFYALFRSYSSVIHETFKAQGLPHLMQRYVIVRLILLAVAVLPVMYFHGLNAMCLAMAVMNLVVTTMEVVTVSRNIRVSPVRILATVVRPLLIAGLLISAVYALVDRFDLEGSLAWVVGAIIFICVAYAGIVLPTDKVLRADFRRLRSGGQ